MDEENLLISRRHYQDLLDQIDELKSDLEIQRNYRRRNRGTNPSDSRKGSRGHPLTDDRRRARDLVSKGIPYYRALLLMTLLKMAPVRGRALTEQEGNRMKDALGKEWRDQNGQKVPARPPIGWLDPNLSILNELANREDPRWEKLLAGNEDSP